MKRYLLAFLFLFVILAVMLRYIPQPLQQATDIDDNAQCNVYCRQTQLVATNLGYGYVVACSGQNLCEVIACCSQIDGVSFSYAGNEQRFLQMAKQLCLQVHTTITLEGITVICGYSPKIQGYLFVDGQKTNLQMAYVNGRVTVGSPLILGSY